MISPNLPPVDAQRVADEVETQAKELGILPEDLLGAVEAIAGELCLGSQVDQVRIMGGQALTASHADSGVVREHHSQLRGVSLSERRIQTGLDTARFLLGQRQTTS